MFDRGTIQLLKIADIPVRLHWSFGLIFIWVGYNAWIQNVPWRGFLFYQFFILLVFLCVVLHEFGHALMARRFGNKTRDIILTPIGGIARLESISEKPWQEFFIAIAGPAVNIVIAGCIALGLWATGQLAPQAFDSYDIFHPRSIGPVLMYSNLVLAAFNCIPAFPMDGGRILRALLSLKWPRVKATLIAARLGQVCAIIFLIFAIWNEEWMLSLVSLFIFFTAGTELKNSQQESILDRLVASDWMIQDFDRLDLMDSLEKPLDLTRKGIEKDYIIFRDGSPVGHLSYQRLVYLTEHKHSSDLSLASIVDREMVRSSGSETLKNIFLAMQRTGVPMAIIEEGGSIRGVVYESQIRRILENKKLLSFLPSG
jgi:Zn-dependent protease